MSAYNFIPIIASIIISSIILSNLPSSMSHKNSKYQTNNLNHRKMKVEDKPDSKYLYAIIVNAGSTGYRAIVFKFLQTTIGELKLLSSDKHEVTPGLSAFAENPKKAADSIQQLLRLAKSSVEEKYWNKTKLQLRVTDGLRQLKEHKSQLILKKLKNLFDSSEFLTNHRSVEIMEGNDEGVLSWFTVNILLKNLTGNFDQTTAVIDLGCGSAQISYIPNGENHTETCIHEYKIMNRNINLFSKSFLNLGAYSGREGTYTVTKTIDSDTFYTSPCLHKDANKMYTFGPNTFHVSGEKNDSGINYEKCLEKIENFVVSITQGDKLTDISGQKIAAISIFFYRAEHAGFAKRPGGEIFVETYYDAAKTECAKEYEDSHAFKCMDLLYIAVLLNKGFGLPNSTKINLLHAVGKHEISWALGAAYQLLKPDENKMSEDKETNPSNQ